MEALFSNLGLDPAKARDVLLIAAAYVAALLSLVLGYRAGGRTWVRRHGLVWLCHGCRAGAAALPLD